jgi:hypothetical protein
MSTVAVIAGWRTFELADRRQGDHHDGVPVHLLTHHVDDGDVTRDRGGAPTMATFVLVHGAGDVGWHWHLLEAELRDQGHDAHDFGMR